RLPARDLPVELLDLLLDRRAIGFKLLLVVAVRDREDLPLQARGRENRLQIADDRGVEDIDPDRVGVPAGALAPRLPSAAAVGVFELALEAPIVDDHPVLADATEHEAAQEIRRG